MCCELANEVHRCGRKVRPTMTRKIPLVSSSRIGFVFLAGCAMLSAQQPPAGWRRADDAPPPPPPIDQPAPADAFGQPLGQQPGRPPQDRGPMPGPDHQVPLPAPPAQLTLAPGTYITVRMNEALSSDRNQPGDPFTATLTQPLVIDGVVVAQRGQPVYGRVAEAQRAKASQPSALGLELTGITLVDGTQAWVQTQLVGRQGGTTPTGEQVGTVAATTAVGAAIGAVADWGRGAAIGGVAG